MSFIGGHGGGGVKRPMEEGDAGGSSKKNPLEVMQMVIKNSQRDIQQKTSEGLPEDPEKLKQIFTRQQMLLELQTEMMTEMAKSQSETKPSPKDAVITYPRKAKMPNDDFYYGFNMKGAPPQGPPGPNGRDVRRFNEERYEPLGRRGPPEPLMGRDFGPGDDDFWSPRGMGMGPPPMGRMGPSGLGRYGPGPGPMGPGPRGFGPPQGHGPRGRGPVQIRRKNMPKEHKGRGMPPTPEEAWDFRGMPGNPLNRPYNGLPSEDRITILKREIFKYDNFPQPLRLIETARHNYPDAHLRTNYLDEPVKGTQEYTGYLDVNGVLMAIERGVNKIDAKVNCYAEALYLMACKPTSYIFINCSRLHKLYEHPSSKVHKNHTFVNDRLKWVLEALHDGVCSIPRTAPNRDFEEIIYTLNLSITQVIKFSPKGYKTDLYIDDLYISSGEGKDKFESNKDAYEEARNQLFKDQKGMYSKKIDKESRLSSIDFFDPSILDIKHSEFKHRVFNNIETLSRKGTYTKDLLNRKERIIAIVPIDEKSDWKCLDETAAANDLLMEYIENNSGTSARCTVYLQGLCYADSYSSKEESARSVAMGRAKYILLKRCTTVIEKKNVDFNNVALTFEQIVEKAGELCMSQPKLLDDKPKPEYNPSDKDPAPNDLSPWVDEFLRDLVFNYGQTDGLDDLIISHLPSYHTKILQDRASELNVAIEVERHKNVAYTIIMKAITARLSSEEFIDYLKAHNNESGRYKLSFKEANEPSHLTPMTKSEKEKEKEKSK